MGDHGRDCAVVRSSTFYFLLSSDPLLDLQVSEGGFAVIFWLRDRPDEVQGTLSRPDSHLNSSRVPPAGQREISTC